MKSFRKDAFAVPVSLCPCQQQPRCCTEIRRKGRPPEHFFHQGQEGKGPTARLPSEPGSGRSWEGLRVRRLGGLAVAQAWRRAEPEPVLPDPAKPGKHQPLRLEARLL